MLAADRTIVEMYETLGMSIHEIAQELGYDEFAVKGSLLKNSLVFRSKAREESGNTNAEKDQYPIFSQNDEEDMKGVLLDLARNGELEIVRASCAKTVLSLNQKERASKRITQMSRTNLNVLVIQQQLEKAKAATKHLNIESSAVLEKDCQAVEQLLQEHQTIKVA